MSMKKLFLLGLIMSAITACSSKPSTDKVETIHEIHGHKRVDYYHWLKDPTRKDEKVISHLKDEKNYGKVNVILLQTSKTGLYTNNLYFLKEK